MSAAEHRRALRIREKAFATVGHAIEFGHNVDTDKPIVLSREPDWNKRLWIEAAHIQRSAVFNAIIGKRQIPETWNGKLLEFTRFLGRWKIK